MCEELGVVSCAWMGSGATDAPSGSFRAVAAGGSHTCAIGSDDTITCWGDNAHGQTDAPQGTFRAVAAGQFHTCAHKQRRHHRLLGRASTARRTRPSLAPKPSPPQFHGCAIGSDDTIACWGENFYGQADAPSGTFKALAVGEFHTCAIRSDDTIACWGNRSTCVDSVCSPNLRFMSPSGTFKALGSGPDYACAIGSDDTIACWGGSTGRRTRPQGPSKPSPPVGIMRARSAATTPSPAGGRTATGGPTRLQAPTKPSTPGSSTVAPSAATAPTSAPVRHIPAPSPATAPSPAGATTPTARRTRPQAPTRPSPPVGTCAIASDDTIACWGDNGSGQADAPSGSFKALDAGAAHTCAIASDDAVICWGTQRSTPPWRPLAHSLVSDPPGRGHRPKPGSTDAARPQYELDGLVTRTNGRPADPELPMWACCGVAVRVLWAGVGRLWGAGMLVGCVGPASGATTMTRAPDASLQGNWASTGLETPRTRRSRI